MRGVKVQDEGQVDEKDVDKFLKKDAALGDG